MHCRFVSRCLEKGYGGVPKPGLGCWLGVARAGYSGCCGDASAQCIAANAGSSWTASDGPKLGFARWMVRAPHVDLPMNSLCIYHTS